MIKRIFNIQIILVLLLAVFLRIIFLDKVPPSPNWDEVSLGYNAYSILKTGKDEWNRFLPLTFEAFGDYKLPVYIYTLVPVIAVFGLDPIALKIPSLLSGIFSVFLIYLIVLQFSKRKDWAILASLLLAISPWHIFLSRIALEANLALGLFLIGFYFLIAGLEKPRNLVISSVFLGLTVFTYNSARVFVPLFLFSFILINKEIFIKLKKKLIIPFLILTLFFGVGFYLAVSQDSSSRYYWVSILDEGAISYLDNARNTSQLPETLNKIVYNRYVYFVESFVTNYLSHFSLQYLITAGGTNYQFSIPNTGMIYLIEGPFLLLGLINMFRKREYRVFLIWLFLAPIPAAITRESPHALRSLFMLGVLQIIISFGIIKFGEFLVEKIAIAKNYWKVVLGIIFFFSLTFYMNKYLISYPETYSESWQYGYSQVLGIVNKVSAENKPIYFTKRYGEPHIFYLFYSKYDPAKYQNNPTLIRYARTNWRWVDKLDNYNFINDWEVKEKLKDTKDAILVTSPGNFPDKGRIINSVYFLDGSKAFDVVEL